MANNSTSGYLYMMEEEKKKDKSKTYYPTPEEMLTEFMGYAKDYFRVQQEPKLEFVSNDQKNADNPIGKTAHYNPDTNTITIYTKGRHFKDVARSAAHEFVHHVQNLRGDFKDIGDKEAGEGYAQTNPALRELEQEAYRDGNMCFRDWEDKYKKNNSQLFTEGKNKGEFKHMGTKEKMTKKQQLQLLKESIQGQVISRMLDEKKINFSDKFTKEELEKIVKESLVAVLERKKERIAKLKEFFDPTNDDPADMEGEIAQRYMQDQGTMMDELPDPGEYSPKGVNRYGDDAQATRMQAIKAAAARAKEKEMGLGGSATMEPSSPSAAEQPLDPFTGQPFEDEIDDEEFADPGEVPVGSEHDLDFYEALHKSKINKMRALNRNHLIDRRNQDLYGVLMEHTIKSLCKKEKKDN